MNSPMRKSELYLFSSEFFRDSNAIHSYIKAATTKVNVADEANKNIEAMHQAMLLSGIAERTDDAYNRALLNIAEINFLNFVAYGQANYDLYQQAKQKVNAIDSSLLSDALLDTYYSVKGEVYLQLFNLRKRKTKSLSPDNITGHELLFVAKRCYSYLLNRYLQGKISIHGESTQKVLLHYCETLGQLSRYIEPFYLLNLLSDSKVAYRASISIAKIQMLEAVFDKTCNAANPLILINIRELIKDAKQNRESMDKRNLPLLSKTDDRVNEILIGYSQEHGISQEEMKRLWHSSEIENKLSGYSDFLAREQLYLNEHFLYCQCKLGTEDSLEIVSSCSHTMHPKVQSFELLLDKLKHEFDNARRAFYRAVQKPTDSRINTSIVKSSSNISDAIISDVYSYDLISAFAKCFAILDKIAVGINYAFSILGKDQSKTIHFHTYFKRRVVRSVINGQQNNLFLIALYSMSQDLDKDSDYAEFYDYKDWRNSIEHNELYLVDEVDSIALLQEKYPDVDFFIPIQEFQQKAMYMLHFCRSAIFTFTWAIRKASIAWDENEEVE